MKALKCYHMKTLRTVWVPLAIIVVTIFWTNSMTNKRIDNLRSRIESEHYELHLRIGSERETLYYDLLSDLQQ